ncbi:Cof-type HAD-IIB family hydrolase [Mycoplasma sp. Ms02]|uniref:Cof-type HAD-IIB family hydrolase n=1 Tax=Mycoplasma sp. Ms02 TaxID=353851 RepID=UPI001C8AEA80|nr:Cof-type HAD-IIB family hydrolase [Mycoplasma sp. Ms02]QZE12200.1 Cof-type HAD-IIB family hydrolase [Mycoplasma sp. Ms02]
MYKLFKIRIDFLNKIREKEKTYEIRLNHENRKNLKEGMIIRLENDANQDDFELAKITSIEKFTNFEELFEVIPFQKAGFSSKSEAISTMYTFYDKADVSKNGVVAFGVELFELHYEDIDAFVFDMDGTLLKGHSEMNPSNSKVMQTLIDDGKKVGVATGRAFFTFDKYLEEIPINLPLITSNGGHIHDYKKDQAVHFEGMNLDAAKEIFATLVKSEVDFLVYTTSGVHGVDRQKTDFFKTRDYNQTLGKNYSTGLEFDFEKYPIITKFLVIHNNDEEYMLEEVQKVMSKYDDVYGLFSLRNFYDIMSINTSKGNALKFLSEHYDFDLSRTMTFGDADNDASNFMMSAYSGFMKNGFPEVRNYANLMMGSNDENWLETFVNWLKR